MILSARKNGGFSLIELSIITTIIALMMSATLQTYRTYLVVKVKNDTEVHQVLVQEALARHLFNFNFLPCPGPPKLAPSAALAGKSDCSPATVVGACNATSGICIVDGARHTTCNPGAVTVKDRVIMGTVPYIDLGISVNDSLDGWGNRMTYAISQYLTAAASYDETCGAINLQVYARATNTISSGFFGGFANAYLFALVSHGPDGKGAYNYYGIQKPCTAGARDSENCDLDSTFLLRGSQAIDSVTSSKVDANFYDDAFVAFDVTRDRDKWTRSGLTAMANKGFGRVGIGGQPDAVNNYMLDVAGNIKLQDFQTDSVCTNAGVCFPQSMIGGSGITCNGGIATGIANSAIICVNKVGTAGLTPGVCASPTLLKGFTAGGGIICLAP